MRGILVALVFCCGLQFAEAQFVLQEVASGLDSPPVAITHAGDGSGRLFITLQGKKPGGTILDAKIMILSGGTVLPTPFLDLTSLVLCCGEQGLLSTAFHPNYQSNGFFYVFYVNAAGDLEIARYTASPPTSNVANPASRMLILTIPHTEASNHNGGQLQFGPNDGYLYISTGDGGTGGAYSQDLDSLLGKILRINVNAGTPYQIPANNPFQVDGDPSTLGEIWAYGLRNPWRFSFDRMNGDLFIGDVGQNCREEVDLQPASSAGGENYGWNIMEGDQCYGGSDCNFAGCDPAPYVPPILAYDHPSISAPCVSTTGGYMYRGAAAQLFGKYLFGDYCSGQIWIAENSGGGWTMTEAMDTSLWISSFGEDESGELYVADAAGRSVHRLVGPSGGPFSDDFEDGVMDWNVNKGTWNETGGSLVNDPVKKAEVTAPYGGCDFCTIETEFRLVTPGGNVALLAWYVDKGNRVELKLADNKDKWTLKQFSNGSLVGKTRAKVPGLGAGIDYLVRITFDGSLFQVFVDGNLLMTLNAAAPAFGNIGFTLKGPGGIPAQASFHYITAN